MKWGGVIDWISDQCKGVGWEVGLGGESASVSRDRSRGVSRG